MARILQDQSVPREQILGVGRVIIGIIVTSILINLVFVTYGFCIEAKKKMRRRAFKNFMKSDKTKELLANVKE